MPSSQKTANLQLSQWQGSDVPKRADFVADNAILDDAIGQLRQQVSSGSGGGNDPRLDEHLADTAAHLSPADRALLAGAAPVAGTYTGNGSLYQNVVAGFSPRAGLIFADGLPAQEPTAAGTSQTVRFAVLGGGVATEGAEVTSTGFRVRQMDGGAGSGQTHLGLNAAGVAYGYLLWK